MIPCEELDLLGSPLSNTAVPAALEKKRDELERLTSRLEEIDAHPALILLKNCFALPKLMYVLRTSPAFRFLEHLRGIDELIKKCVSAVSNTHLTDESWRQARLPVRHGGLGIRTCEDISSSAFLASHYATKDLVERILRPSNLDRQLDPQDALQCWQSRAPNIPLPADLKSQRLWDDLLCKLVAQHLLDEADQVSRARLLSAREDGTGAWLHAIPSPALGTLMDNECLRIAVALRVGAAVCQPHRCRCGREVDSLGHHTLSCTYSAGRNPRHAALNDIVKRALVAAGIPSHLEPRGLDRGDGRQPDGVTVFPYRHGKPLTWDATCTDTFAATNVNQCALQAGHAANAAETRKRLKYQTLTDRYIFQPVSVETTGVLGGSTKDFLKELGRRISTETGDLREGAWLRQRISIAIARGNAQCVITSARVLQ